MVGSADVKFPIRLEGIMYKHSLYCSVRRGPDRPNLSWGLSLPQHAPVSSLMPPPAFMSPSSHDECWGHNQEAPPAESSRPSRTLTSKPSSQTSSPRRATAQYEPELFPGLIYRMVEPKIVLLIFVSGKVVLTGGKVKNEINDAFQMIFPVLEEFKKREA
eukprot:7381235-Prymnesium_polylepis.1